MPNEMKDELTDKQFWNDYWQNLVLPCTVNKDFSFDRCLRRCLLQRINEVISEEGFESGRRKSVLEVGAAPGKWLSIFPQASYSVSGLEYSKAGMDALRKNLEMLSIHPLELIHGDFFSIDPNPNYDLVMSLGFIEHFNDPITVVERHIKWLRPGGILIIGVPNFTGIHGTLQKYLDHSILLAHNTSIMNKQWFEDIGPKLNIKSHSIDYLGSFEPTLPLTYAKLSIKNFALKIILRLACYIRRWKYIDKFNSPYISSYILGVYQKKV